LGKGKSGKETVEEVRKMDPTLEITRTEKAGKDQRDIGVQLGV
jgi:hypothetical protein